MHLCLGRVCLSHSVGRSCQDQGSFLQTKHLIEQMEKLTCLVSFLVLIHLTRASSPPKIQILVISETSIGGEATLFCSLGSGTRPVQFIWTRDGSDIDPRFVTSAQTSSTIIISSASIEDRGRYTCKIKSPFGEDSKSGDLVIKGRFGRETKRLISNHLAYLELLRLQ